MLGRVRKDGDTERSEEVVGGPLARLDWDAVRDLVGLQSAAIIQETGIVVWNETRDLVRSEVTVIKEQIGKVLPGRR